MFSGFELYPRWVPLTFKTIFSLFTEMGVYGVYFPWRDSIRFSAPKAYVQAKSILSSLNTVVSVFTKLFEKI